MLSFSMFAVKNARKRRAAFSPASAMMTGMVGWPFDRTGRDLWGASWLAIWRHQAGRASIEAQRINAEDEAPGLTTTLDDQNLELAAMKIQ